MVKKLSTLRSENSDLYKKTSLMQEFYVVQIAR